MEAGWGRYNILRPEVVESIFMLWRITGDKQYQEWGWTIFQAFQKWAKVWRAVHPHPSPPAPALLDNHVHSPLSAPVKYIFESLLGSQRSALPTVPSNGIHHATGILS